MKTKSFPKKRLRVKSPVALLRYIHRRIKGSDAGHWAVDLTCKEGLADYVNRCLKSYKKP